ncbi:hypothetical protein BKA69DRAFT_1056363 [Paraphysoderma sedebokerense]|nr:hypothetical protein BKA69DRAFT_1056363 [Paraphysoderma sedebokerense]
MTKSAFAQLMSSAKKDSNNSRKSSKVTSHTRPPPANSTTKSESTNTILELVDCPICGNKIVISNINSHLDSNCKSFVQVRSKLPESSTRTTKRKIHSSDNNLLSDVYLKKSKTESDDTVNSTLIPTELCSDSKPTFNAPNTTSTSQASLHTFFGGIDTSFPTYYYLYFCAQSNKITTRFSHTKPEKIKWSKEIYLREVAKTIVVCTNVETLDGGIKTILGEEKEWSNIPLLKSHLQKSVRRGKSGLAVQTSVHLMRMDLIEFIRRIPIVQVEDVHLTTSFPILTWFLLSISKSFVPNETLISHILGIIHSFTSQSYHHVPPWDTADIASFLPSLPRTSPSDSPPTIPSNLSIPRLVSIIEKSRYNIPSSSPVDSHNSKNDLSLCSSSFYVAEKTPIPDWCRSCVYALIIRKCMGGMSGDMKMLHNLAWTWYYTFSMTAQTSNESVSMVPSNSNTSVDSTSSSFSSSIEKRIPQSIRLSYLEKLLTLNYTPILPSSVPPLTSSNFLLCAIDFHISNIDVRLHSIFQKLVPTLSDLTNYNLKNIDIGVIKSAIWNCSAGKNIRKRVKIGLDGWIEIDGLNESEDDREGKIQKMVWEVIGGKRYDDCAREVLSQKK